MIKTTAKTFRDHTDRMTHEEWLEYRRQGIGGSEASAILGVNPYATPLSVYMDKIGKAQEKEANEAMRQGTDLEDYVARRFMEETGFRVKKLNKILQHPEYPWMRANIDRDIVKEDAGLECKTTSPYTKFKFDEGEINPHYYWQCQHYMAVTGASRWYLAVLVLGKSFHVFQIDRDESAIATLTEAEKTFWQDHVQRKAPPLPTGTEADGDAVNALYPAASDEQAPADLEEMNDLLNLRALKKKEIAALEEQVDGIEQMIKMAMRDSEKGTSSGWSVSWTNTVSSRVDTKLLKAKYPEIAAECMKSVPSRRFTVTQAKTAD